METLFPQDDGFSGLFLVGFRKDPNATSETQRVGSFVLKRQYSIAGGVLTPDPVPEPVRIADLTGPWQFEHDGSTETASMDGETLLVVREEADIVPFKPESDMIVLGYYRVGDVCEARVNGQLWLRRDGSVLDSEFDFDGSPVPDPDAQVNMFGWEQRMFDPRRSEAGAFSGEADDYPPQWPVPAGNPNKDPLHPDDFSNDFFNGYRRAFKTQAGFAGRFAAFSDPLVAPASIVLSRSGEADYQFSLRNERISARCFVYCGHGPDRASRWCPLPIPEVRLDTLVVEPELDRVYALWRGNWDFDDEPTDRYRRLEITAEDS